MSRLREGRANTARGAAHFLRETVGRVRYAGANGRLTLRADSLVLHLWRALSVCRKMDVRFSITIRQHKSLHNLIEAIPEDAWTPIPYWMDGAADVAETTCTPFQAEADAAPVRLIVRRVKPTPGSPTGPLYSLYHGFITDRDGELLLEADHATRDRECHRGTSSTASMVWTGTISPRAASPPTAPGWPSKMMDLARWTARSLGERIASHQDPPAAVLLPGRTAHPLLTLHLPDRWPWASSAPRLGPVRAIPLPASRHLGDRPTHRTTEDGCTADSLATPVARVPCCVFSERHPAHRSSRRRP